MNSIPRVALLVRLILSDGKFRHSGHDPRNIRREALAELSRFLPRDAQMPVDGNGGKKWLKKNPFIRSWHSQAAFVKDAFRKKGRHLWAPAANVCYVRNPKAASTSLSYALLSARYPELKDFRLTPQKINFLADINLREGLSGDEKKAEFFTVVRNPFARLVSVYREFFEKQNAQFIYEDYLFGILRKELSFSDFVKRLELIPDRLKDQHLRPQHCFLNFYERNKVAVRILRLEESQDINAFMERHGLTLEKFNTAEFQYDYRHYYDRETVRAVYNIYKDDVARFGYASAYDEIRKLVE